MKSAPDRASDTDAWGVRWTASTYSHAPTACTRSATAGRSGRVPIRLEAPVTATSLVRGPSASSREVIESSAVSGSKSTQRTVAPAASAAITHGRTLPSWSRRVTPASSPGVQSLAMARLRSKVSWVKLRPNTTPPGAAPSRSPSASRAPTTARSAFSWAIVRSPRLDSGPVSAARTASPTTYGVCEPPGPSKNASPLSRAGKWLRTFATSYSVTPGTIGPALDVADPGPEIRGRQLAGQPDLIRVAGRVVELGVLAVCLGPVVVPQRVEDLGELAVQLSGLVVRRGGLSQRLVR